MADIDDFDLDRITNQAWAEFQTRLSEVISMIDESGDLTIGTAAASTTDTITGSGGPFVRFSSPARDLLLAEAASNATLGENFQLDARRLQQMEALGWVAPTADGPDASANFTSRLPQDQSDQLAALATATLRDVYGVQHPVFLAPDQLAEILQPHPAPLEAPAPDMAAADIAVTVPKNQAALDELVETQLVELFGHQPIRDSEGDIAIRVGSTMVFLRTSVDGQEITIFAALVHDISGRSRAAEVLNDLNVEARWVKFQLIRDRVFVTLSIPARPFVPAHLRQAVRIMTDVADGIDEELATKLGGRTTFSDRDEPH